MDSAYFEHHYSDASRFIHLLELKQCSSRNKHSDVRMTSRVDNSQRIAPSLHSRNQAFAL